ncbi:MAG: HRDC domain-containing protein, partial [Kiritimatiellae bacterium]|nr:HRDC domain-containing protein [Kiritimatiellia bacterium]
PRMVEYAVSDTKYLKALAEVLRKQLETKGRLDWHRQLCDQLVRDCTSTSHRNDVEQWRIKGSARLGPRALAVLKAAWEWREREARARNQPPFFVLPHKILIRLAELAGAGLPVAGAIPRRMPAHRRKALLEVIRHAASLPEYDRPSPMEPTGRRLTLVEKQRLAKLRSVRDWQAARLGLDPALIASRATLIALARDWSANVSLLLPWQRELLEETPAGVLFGRDGRLDSQNV